MKAILRTQLYNSISSMVQQFKAHVWPILEGSNGAIFHAASSYLKPLDDIQSSFLLALGISERDAFLEHNMAPLGLRRDIGALGLLHKITLGASHPAFRSLLPAADRTNVPRYVTRDAAKLHNKTFYDRSAGSHLSAMKRSIFAAVRVHNRLPQLCVDAETVSGFQRSVTEIARTACRARKCEWQRIFQVQARSC